MKVEILTHYPERIQKAAGAFADYLRDHKKAGAAVASVEDIGGGIVLTLTYKGENRLLNMIFLRSMTKEFRKLDKDVKTRSLRDKE